MKRILITGLDSYIGSSFEKWLSQPQFSRMYQVDTVDMRGNIWKKKDFSGYDTVFHVAGIAHADVGKITEEQKKLYYKVNCELAVETAEQARASGVKQFIYMSSIIIYGGENSIREKKVITRETRPSPANFYGDSKWKAEQELMSLSDQSFHILILRPPMIYGKDCKGNYQLLKKIAMKIPVFPDFPNQRSMCSIETLCEFVRRGIECQAGGVYFPQDQEYMRTSRLVRMIARDNEKTIRLVKGFNWIIYLAGYLPGKTGRLANKAFGSVVYEKGINTVLCGINDQPV